jgi:hypothetical protein
MTTAEHLGFRNKVVISNVITSQGRACIKPWRKMQDLKFSNLCDGVLI